jgi:hypothetical protein
METESDNFVDVTKIMFGKSGQLGLAGLRTSLTKVKL